VSRKRSRANGEGSIFPYRNGYGAYVWVSKPGGLRGRKYIYGKTREIVHGKWLDLHRRAREGPVATSSPTLAEYLEYWLREIVTPNLRPKTTETYAMHVRLYIEPGLGKKRLDKITVRDVRTWLNRLAETCQCCAQGKDARRSKDERRCCALQPKECCDERLGKWTLYDARNKLRTALGNAVTEELIAKNVAQSVKLPTPRSRHASWSVEEARRFLVTAQETDDPFYAAYVLVLVLGLRRGEVLGLTWDGVNLDAGELTVDHGLQRIGGQLVHGETQTAYSDAVLPLPEICVAALRQREKAQAAEQSLSGPFWSKSGFVFTTDHGTPIEPRNFVRSFKRLCERADVRPIRVHDTRHTCASLLAALDVHPRVAMQVLRHSKIAVTMEVYTQVPSEITRAALKRLGDSLGEVAR
jgi:integrase